MRLLFSLATSRHVTEAPHPADRHVVDALRLRVSLERAAIFQLQHVVARFFSMTIELDDLRHELVRIDELLESGGDGALIVAAGEHLGRDLPHVGHLLIEAQDLPI